MRKLLNPKLFQKMFFYLLFYKLYMKNFELFKTDSNLFIFPREMIKIN